MASLFLIQAIMNIGCGSKGCNVPFSKNNTNQKVEDLSFGELKQKQQASKKMETDEKKQTFAKIIKCY